MATFASTSYFSDFICLQFKFLFPYNFLFFFNLKLRPHESLCKTQNEDQLLYFTYWVWRCFHVSKSFGFRRIFNSNSAHGLHSGSGYDCSCVPVMDFETDCMTGRKSCSENLELVGLADGRVQVSFLHWKRKKNDRKYIRS